LNVANPGVAIFDIIEADQPGRESEDSSVLIVCDKNLFNLVSRLFAVQARGMRDGLEVQSLFSLGVGAPLQLVGSY